MRALTSMFLSSTSPSSIILFIIQLMLNVLSSMKCLKAGARFGGGKDADNFQI